jgi:DNA-binding NarL/FixJ family response regulator
MAAPRILVVEDEFLLACSLEETLAGFGYEVVGPYSTLSRATDAARRERFDAALLDVNLSGLMVYPLADELAARGIPIVFLSGYGFGVIPPRFSPHPQLSKPSDPGAIDRALRRVLAPRGRDFAAARAEE